MKYRLFASRNAKELFRDPLSYLFCLGLPLLMLIIMSVVNASMPAEANMVIFNIRNLAPGIAVFGFAFVMLFACIQLSKDRSSAFLIRLYASPMRAFDFILGYTLPFLLVALGQCVVTFAASAVIAAITGEVFPVGNLLLTFVVLLPGAILFLALGLLFGSLFHDKAAPPVCSIIITLSAMMGGIFMDVDMLGGALKKICMAFPFYHAVRCARAALQGAYGELWIPLLIVSIYAVVLFAVAVFTFQRKMKQDIT